MERLALDGASQQLAQSFWVVVRTEAEKPSGEWVVSCGKELAYVPKARHEKPASRGGDYGGDRSRQPGAQQRWHERDISLRCKRRPVTGVTGKTFLGTGTDKEHRSAGLGGSGNDIGRQSGRVGYEIVKVPH